MGPLISLFWTSGDVSYEFKSQNGQPYSHLAEAYMFHVPLDSPLVQHLLTSRWPTWQPSHSLPHTCKQMQGLVGLKTGIYCAEDEHSADWAMPAQQKLNKFEHARDGRTEAGVLHKDPSPMWTEWQTNTNESITFPHICRWAVIKPRRFGQYWRRLAESFETFLHVCLRIKDSVKVFNVIRQNWMKFAPVRK